MNMITDGIKWGFNTLVATPVSAVCANPARYGLTAALAKTTYDVAMGNGKGFAGQFMPSSIMSGTSKNIAAVVLAAATVVSFLGKVPYVR